MFIFYFNENIFRKKQPPSNLLLFYVILKDKSNFGSMDQLTQSAQFYFLNSNFNQKSKSVKMW